MDTRGGSAVVTRPAPSAHQCRHDFVRWRRAQTRMSVATGADTNVGGDGRRHECRWRRAQTRMSVATGADTNEVCDGDAGGVRSRAVWRLASGGWAASGGVWRRVADGDARRALRGLDVGGTAVARPPWVACIGERAPLPRNSQRFSAPLLQILCSSSGASLCPKFSRRRRRLGLGLTGRHSRHTSRASAG